MGNAKILTLTQPNNLFWWRIKECKLLLKNVKDSMDWNLVWIFVFEYFVRIVFSFYYFFF